jgi:hypothetical protein
MSEEEVMAHSRKGMGRGWANPREYSRRTLTMT